MLCTAHPASLVFSHGEKPRLTSVPVSADGERTVAWADPQSAGTTCNIQPLLWKSPHRGQDQRATRSCVWRLVMDFLGLDVSSKPLAVINTNAYVMWIATDTRAAAPAEWKYLWHLLLDVIHQVLKIQVIPVVHDGLLHKLSQSIPSLRETDTERELEFINGIITLWVFPIL